MENRLYSDSFSSRSDGKKSEYYLRKPQDHGIYEDEYVNKTLFRSVSTIHENEGISKQYSKGLYVFFGITFLGSGLILLVLGVYILFDSQRTQLQRLVLLSLDNFSASKPVLYYMTITVVGAGGLIFICGLWTLFATLKKNLCMLVLSGVFLFLLICGQMTLGCISVAYQMGVERKLKTELLYRLYETYNMPGEAHFTTAMDYVQTEGCLEAIVNWAKLELLLITGISAGICIFEAVGIIIIIHLCRWICRQNRSNRSNSNTLK